MSVASNSNDENDFKETPFEKKFTWTAKSIEKLKELHVVQQGNWKSISSLLNGPTPLECMFKWQQQHPDQTSSRQLWSPEEDEQLKELVQKFGKKWSKICTVMNWRTGKQVRERYLNQLQGTIKQEKWTEEEDKLILKLYRKFGTKWSYISSFLNGRPENMVKNRFYANLKRRYQCDLGDSDDEDFQEESINSSDEEKSNLQRRRRSQKTNKEPQKMKKIQVSDENIENFQRMTRSKNQKQNDDIFKQQGHNDYQNNENISGLQKNIASSPSYCTPQGNQINIKEENQIKCEHFHYNSSNNQQSIPQINMYPQPISSFIFNNQFLPSQQTVIYPLNNQLIIPDKLNITQQPQFKEVQVQNQPNQLPRMNYFTILNLMQQQQQMNFQNPIFTCQIHPNTQQAYLFNIQNNLQMHKSLQP